MTLPPADGTRFVAPAMAANRSHALSVLRDLYAAWGYERVEAPALERFDDSHPRSAQSFKLVDRDGTVLSLRTHYTPALAQLVRVAYPAVANGSERALRLSYDGVVWHAIDPELARAREFTQVGIELIGVSNARADAEIIHLARESVRAVGLTPRVEVGNPAFVSALFDAADVPARSREPLADAIDRKDVSDVTGLVGSLGLRGRPADAIVAVPDLYGDAGVLEAARRLAPSPAATEAVDRLEGVVAEFEDASELMLDLAMARRLSYYTGVTFRAYTFDFGQPLLGGGRYDGALLPSAAGFSLGLERLLAAVNGASETVAQGDPLVVSLDDEAARRLRRAGFRVVRATGADLEAAEREAHDLGAACLVTADGPLLLRGGGGRDDAGRGDGGDLDTRDLAARLRAALAGST
jgi:ATP phosphoribosyltransferase regulatory subunit